MSALRVLGSAAIGGLCGYFGGPDAIAAYAVGLVVAMVMALSIGAP